MGRLFSGASLSFSVAQRDNVQQGVLFSSLTASQGWTWGGTVGFNPAALFITSANWKTAASAMDGTNRTFSTDEDNLEHECFVQRQNRTVNLRTCENEFARPRLRPSKSGGAWSNLAAVALPTFKLQVLSQFDFLKQGGILTVDPLLQRSLKNMTFTWDLTRLIPATGDRLTVGTSYNAAAKSGGVADPKQVDNSKASKLCVMISGKFRSYVKMFRQIRP